MLSTRSTAGCCSLNLQPTTQTSLVIPTFLRVRSSALEQQLRHDPFVFYEADPGSGVSPRCAFPLSDSLRVEVGRAALRNCSEADSLDSQWFELRNNDACEAPEGIVYEIAG